MTNTVVVAGGGIAGTVTALALHRAGLSPHIHEAQDRDADDRGAWLTVAVNGLNALRDLDLDPGQVLAAGFPTTRNQLRGATGQLLADLPLGGPTSDGVSTTSIRRADLYAALRQHAVAAGIPISYGQKLVEVTPAGSGIEATFSDGSTAGADLLVGADGLHSRTRKALDPSAPAPRYLGLLNAGGFTAGPVASAPPPGVMQMAFGRRAFFGWATAPDGSVWWFANPPRRTPVEPGEFTPDGWRACLLDMFAGEPFPAVELIEASPDVLGPWNTWDVPRLPVWHNDRIVLVGDAAHAVSPSSGQGASMAIEDAVELARCLRDLPVDAAFGAFEGMRRERVERVVAQGARTSGQKAAGPVARVFRDAFLPIFLKRAAGKGGGSVAWLHRYSIDWDAPVAQVR
jgi:FAD-dependent urate hydroxylase